VDEPSLPTWDLVLCTVGRRHEPDRLLASLAGQTHHAFRVVLVDQNDDDRLVPLLRRYAEVEVLHLHSPRGLSRARNVALPHLRAELVALPDDDCAYPPDLLERAARRFAEDATLDGLTGRDADARGRGSRDWPAARTTVTAQNVWYHGLSAAVFLRRGLIERVGPFDEQLGLGSATAWSSGEEVDYLIRATRLGARLQYDPQLVVEHETPELDRDALRAIGRRDGGAVGYLLRKHSYPPRAVARMLVRPMGGAAVSLARRDPTRARYHLDTLRGRLAGYAARGPTSSSKSSV
jgi:glycosyltransferase involved in cell wall biosynthesis